MMIVGIVNSPNPLMIFRDFSTKPLLSNYQTRLNFLLKKKNEKLINAANFDRP